jgi:hypothetical protein
LRAGEHRLLVTSTTIQTLLDRLSPVAPWPAERTNLRRRLVAILNGPSHATRDRQALILRLTSEMAIVHAGAKRASRDDAFHTFEKGLFFGLGVAAVLMVGTREGRVMLNCALTMSEDL